MKTTLCFIAGALSCAAAFSQNWTGAVNTDWNNPANWSQMPSNGDDILIDPANYSGAMAQPSISTNSAFIPAEMIVQNGAKLTIAANLSAGDRCEILGAGSEIVLNAGTFAVNGSGNNARIIFSEDSKLTVNGGALNVGQRLLFELGGSGIINNGTVTVGETVAIVDGSLVSPSNLTLNGGTLTTNGEFGFENEAGSFFPWFRQTGGTLHVNGDMLCLGVSPGAGRATFSVEGGTANITGMIANDPASTINMTVSVSGAASVLNMSGNSISQLAGDSVKITGDGKWINTSAVNWQNNGTVYSASGGLFNSGNTTLSGSGVYQFHHILTPAGKTLTHLQPTQIAVSGNLQVNGSFAHGNNKLLLNGDAPQLIVTNNAAFYDLEIRNSQPANMYGVEFSSPANISHEIRFTDGLVRIDPAFRIAVAQTAIIAGGSDTSFVYGYMEKSGNSAVTFPLGAAPDKFRPLSIGASQAQMNVLVSYADSAYASVSPFEAPLQSVSELEYWDLSSSVPANSFSVTAGWNNAAQSGLPNCSDITLTVWDGEEWKFVSSSATGICSGNSGGSLVSSVDLPFAGPLTIGFTGNVHQQVVHICHTDSLVIGDSIYYQDGIYTNVFPTNSGDSTVITVLHVSEALQPVISAAVATLTVSAPGASAYQWVDCNNGYAAVDGATENTFSPLANGSYAVVVYQEYCSTGDTSACAGISQLGLNEIPVIAFDVFPNPLTNGDELMIRAGEGIGQVIIYSADGKILFRQLASAAENTMELLPEGLSGGIYFVEIITRNGRGVKQLMIR